MTSRALHEVRRPLQALALSLDGSNGGGPAADGRVGLVEMAVAALGDLEGAINGQAAQPAMRLVSCRRLVQAAVERWCGEEEALRVYWDAGPALVLADPYRISQALDNLIVNAIEHGEPPLVLTGSRISGRVRLTLSSSRRVSRNDGPPRREHSERRGHGIPVVSEVATAHGGRFALDRSPTGSVAALELPLAQSHCIAA